MGLPYFGEVNGLNQVLILPLPLLDAQRALGELTHTGHSLEEGLLVHVFEDVLGGGHSFAFLGLHLLELLH